MADKKNENSLNEASPDIPAVNSITDTIRENAVRSSPIEKKLQESENMFRTIVENSHAGIFIIDGAFHITYANNRLAEILGYTQEEIVGKDFRYFLDEESKIMVADRYVRRRRGEDLPSRYEFSFFRQDGEKRRAELSSAVVKDFIGQTLTVGQMLDITDRKTAEEDLRKAHDELEMRVEERTAELQKTNAMLQEEIELHNMTLEALHQSEVKYRHLIDNANSIIMEMDTKGNVVFFNKFAQEFFGYSESEILGLNVVGTIVSPADSAGKDLAKMIDDIIEHPESYLHNENENVLRNGEKVWIIWTNQPIYDEDSHLKEILCIGINRTEQKKAEDLIAQQLKERAAIQERSRLARDLHDAVSQTLFSASLIAEVIPKLWERNPEEGRKRLEEIRQLTRGALAEMRTLLLELRPAALTDAELGDLLRQLSESITGRARIPVTVDIQGRCEMSPEVKVALYRIAQEALNNVAKHSKATRAEVTLHCQPQGVNLTISDNGKGFDVQGVQAESLGLGIMRERTRGIGARLSVDSQVKKGTKIRVDWELSPREEQK
jgi:PAS domain S-box-containing protein